MPDPFHPFQNWISILLMMLRFENRIARLIVVFAMTISVVLFAFSMPASNHEPDLHAVASEQGTAVSHDDHHSGHSHDEVADASGDQAGSHHHADHSHEKAGFLGLPGLAHHASTETVFSRPVKSLTDGSSGGIDRPPRSAFRI
ncbi:hypothetical protein [Agrobacterium pusense]|uniref:hypothetical protein n=1 Tax=Agrobacterium pusense TaxID=648995 RepID=UPI0032DA73E0